MKRKFILAISIFIVSWICHFMYNIFPNTLFSILFPVNESIWEHMKLLVTPVLIVLLFKRFICNNSNDVLGYILSSIIAIILYLTIYLPINYLLGHNGIFAIILLFIIDIVIVIISSYINNYKIKYRNTIGIILIIITYIIFFIGTYYPGNNDIFLDKTNNTYGIIRRN